MLIIFFKINFANYFKFIIMDVNQFLENVAEQLDEMDPALLSLETEFKELDEWSSLAALSLIAMVDEEYDVALSGNDIRNSKTLGDLKKIIEEKS